MTLVHSQLVSVYNWYCRVQTTQGHNPGVLEQRRSEITWNPLSSPQKLVEEQLDDPKLCKLREQAMSETEACKVPV